MSSPGGPSRGRVSITVAPDTSGFARELRTRLDGVERRYRARIGVVLDRRGLESDLRATAAAIGSAAAVRVPVTIDARDLRAQVGAAARLPAPAVRLPATLDTAGLRGEADRAARTAGRDVPFRAFLSGTASVVAGTGRLVASLAKLGAGAVAVKLLAAGAIGLAAALGQAAGVAGLLPGALALAGVAAATLAVGFRGVGDAVKAAGDPAAFGAALANLAPSAAATVRAFAALGPTLRGLRLDVQQALFAGMANEVRALSTLYIPVLRTGMVGVAGALSDAGDSARVFLHSSSAVRDTAGLFDTTRRAIAGVGPAVGLVLAGFADLAVVGSGVVADLTPGIAAMARRFAEFTDRVRESGALDKFFRSALATLAAFGSVLGNVGSALLTVLRAGAETGGGLLSILERITGSLADFLKSAEGQSALGSFFDVAAQAAGTLLELFRSLTPALSPLLGIVSTLATAGFGVLAVVAKALAPVIVHLAEALQPVAAQLGGVLLVAAMKLAGPLGQIADIAGRVLVGALSALLSGEGLPSLVTSLAQVADIAGGLLLTAFTTLEPHLPAIAAALGQAATIAPTLAAGLADLLTAALPLLPPLLALSTSVIPPAVAVTRFLIEVTAALAGVLLAVLVPALTFVIDATRAVYTAVWQSWQALVEFLTRLWHKASETARQVWSAITEQVSTLVHSAVEAVRRAWDRAVSFVADAWRRIVQSVTGGGGDVVGYAAELPGKILAALGDLANLLFEAGKDMIRGLVRGLRALGGEVLSYFRGLASDAVHAVTDMLGISSPSKVFLRIGHDTAEGFALGISDGTAWAGAAARDLAAAATFTAPAPTVDAGRVAPVTIHVHPRADQSEWSIATAVDRALTFAGRA